MGGFDHDKTLNRQEPMKIWVMSSEEKIEP